MAAAEDPGLRRDATGRRLAYLPAAILGNGSLLVTLSARGEVERLFWPHVDGPNHVHELRLGIRDDGDVVWLDELEDGYEQSWEDEASVLRTTLETPLGRVTITDVVDPDEPVLVRRLEAPTAAVVVSCLPTLEGVDHPAGGFVADPSGIVVLHRRRAALALAVDLHEAEAAVGSVDGRGDDVAHVAPLWGRVEAVHGGVAHVVVALGATPFEALARARRHVTIAGEAAARRAAHDERLLVRTAREPASDPDLARLVRRSVLVLEQLADHATGGIVAAPEMDERFTESGGYGFVWPRDLAYVVLGLLAGGCDTAAAAALRWLARTQAPEGLWLHRYWTTGEPAPSWGLHQVDETGAALLAIEAAFRELEDEELDAALWPAVRAGAEFLLTFLEPERGLPRASTDLWEQHDGVYTYSAASVSAGLRAAGLSSARHEPDRAAVYASAASAVEAAIDRHLWDDPLGRYVRALEVARRDDAGEPPGPAYERGLPYPNRRVRSVDPVDTRLDGSLLGLAWPFASRLSTDRVRATVAAVANGLVAPGGGLHRHEGDIYAGGHEWPLVTLWLGLAARALGDNATHAATVSHVTARRTSLDFLPEQVFPDGSPAWVLPLGWSHAMLLCATNPELRLVRELRAGS